MKQQAEGKLGFEKLMYEGKELDFGEPATQMYYLNVLDPNPITRFFRTIWAAVKESLEK